MKIERYEFGMLEVDGRTYRHDVIILPDRVEGSWWRKEGHRLHPDDLAQVVDARPDVVVVGTGYHGRMRIPGETLSFLESMGIAVRSAPTGDAVKEFNELQKKCARVVAALHLTC